LVLKEKKKVSNEKMTTAEFLAEILSKKQKPISKQKKVSFKKRKQMIFDAIIKQIQEEAGVKDIDIINMGTGTRMTNNRAKFFDRLQKQGYEYSIAYIDIFQPSWLKGEGETYIIKKNGRKIGIVKVVYIENDTGKDVGFIFSAIKKRKKRR